MNPIPGHATPEGTARYAARFGRLAPGHYRDFRGLSLSSIGLGTYLGEPTTEFDRRYREAIEGALELGVNVLDSAINYRHQRSERTMGEAIRELVGRNALRRDEVFVSTKGGFLCFDGDEPADPARYFDEKLIRAGLVRPEEVVAGCHVMSPRYLESQIEASRRNLGLETIDLYYLHNPETQLSEVPRDEFNRRLKSAFAAFEKAVSENKIRAYGTATWNAYRAGENSPDAVPLEDVLRAAEEAGGKDHHFRAIQLPFNLAMPEALVAGNQPLEGKRVPALQVARVRDLAVFASASLLQSKLSRGLPAEMQSRFPGLTTDAQRAIQFVRSTPGITSALVGMSRRAHVVENMATAATPPLSLENFRANFRK